LFPDGEAEGGGEVVVGAEVEGAELGVGVFVDADLVVEELADEEGGFGGGGEVDALGLEEDLEAADEEGFADAPCAAVAAEGLVGAGEVDFAEVEAGGAEEVDDGCADASGVDPEDGGEVAGGEVGVELGEAAGDFGIGDAEGEALDVAGDVVGFAAFGAAGGGERVATLLELDADVDAEGDGGGVG
jgi:hypothetical protein